MLSRQLWRYAARIDRRRFVLALAAGTVAGLAGCAAPSALTTKPAGTDAAPSPNPIRADSATVAARHAATASTPAPTPSEQFPRTWPDAVISGLPGDHRRVALTIDDGVSSAVVAAYAQFAKDSGARLTFFVNGFRPSWTENAPALRPLVESGQVQLANHTWDHPDLRTKSDSEIRDQLSRNDRFVRNIYGVSTLPYLRPPYGFHNQRVRQVARDEGYSTIVIWYGSLGDSLLLTEDQVLANARTWIAAERIVIGHANHPAVTHVYDQLLEIIRERALTLVTLDDVFLRGR